MSCFVTNFFRFSFVHTVVYAIFIYVVCTHFFFLSLPCAE